MSKYNNSPILSLDTEIFKELIKNSKTWKEVMSYFVENHGYKATYSNITFKKRCIREGIDFSHFKVSTKIKYTDNDLIINRNTKSGVIKRKLLREKILEEICSNCGLGTTWQGKPISLQLEHIDGDHFNNDISNLTLLCPNCHSQTDTWCGRNVTKEKNKCIDCDKIIKNQSTRCKDCYYKSRKSKKSDIKPRVKQCLDCGEGITKTATYCIDCAHKQSRKVINRPSLEQIMDDLKELGSYTAVGRKYGVVDNSIKKWIKAYQKEV